jgi:hypothetical protein
MMKTRIFSLTVIATLVSLFSFSQTKKIAYESHSGNLDFFESTLNDELFDNGDSDFGLPSSKSKYKIDSVIYLNDTTTVLIYKSYKGSYSAKDDKEFQFEGTKTDTVTNSIFGRKAPVDSIRNGINNMSNMVVEYVTGANTKFVGFEAAKSKPKGKQKQNMIPVTFQDNDQSPFDPSVTWMLSAIFGLSLLGGFISWKFYKQKSAVATI